MMNLLDVFFPKANSDYASQVDALYWYLNIVSVFFTVLIVVLVIVFAVKYRRRSEDERPAPIHGNNLLEITWSVIPFLLMLVMFVWGTWLHFQQVSPPEGETVEVNVTGKQWMWMVQHPNGKREKNDLTVPVGKTIRLTINSEDVIHSYYIPAMRVKRDAVPGMYTTFHFTPRETGEYHIFCAEYCGTEHSLMKGTLRVVSEQAYQDWLNTGWNVPTIELDPAGVPADQAAAAADTDAPPGEAVDPQGGPREEDL